MRPHLDRLLVYAAEVLLRDAAMDHHAAVAVVLREDLAVGGQVGQQPAVLDAELNVHVEEAAAQGVAHRGVEVRQPEARPGTDRHGVRVAAQQAVEPTSGRAWHRPC